MKEHYVTVKQNYVGQFHWKIEGYVWLSTRWKGDDIHPEEREYGLGVRHLRYSQINTSGAVPQIKQKQLKLKRGRKSSKLKETVRR